jgi:hypothetical protein
MCLKAPRSTYHPTLEIMLVERHNNMEKVVLSQAVNLSTSEASTLLAKYFSYCHFPFPFLGF